jgi:CubicO group peptidase (beta-lactamase class C family)
VAIDVLGAVVAAVAGATLPDTVRQLVTDPLAMHDTAFSAHDRARLATPYGDGQPVPERMGDPHTVIYFGNPVHFSPGRVFDPRAFPSGGAGMAGSASDVLRLLEAVRTARIVSPGMRAAMLTDHVGPEAQTQGPGWGFGYGGAVLVDPAPTGTPQSAGTLQWGGAYGHSWFIDPVEHLTVVALTNTTFEGMSGRFTLDVRDAAYER